jgi:GNAT superfamily N-acetyltransferase
MRRRPGLVVESLSLPAEEFSHLTYPRCRGWLAHEAPSGVVRIAIGAGWGGYPIGLALLCLEPDEGRWRLWSIAVAPPWRRQGVGLDLMRKGEAEVRARGTQTLVAYHSSRMAHPGVYQALLSRAGWSPPVAGEHRIASRADWALPAAADWHRLVQRARSRGYTATPWCELDPDDRAAVEAIVSRGLPLPALDPFRWEQSAEPTVSLALRGKGRVVGWVIGQEDPETGAIHYPAGHVIPGFQRAGWLVVGMLDACRRQVDAFGSDSVAVLSTWAANQPMIRLIAERLGPRSLWTDTRYVATKSLSSTR